MKVTLPCLALCAAMLLSTVGCSSTGHLSEAGTSVSLAAKNYKIVKAGAIGRSSGFRLLGIIPFASPSYAHAKASLYKSVGQPLTDRAIALANQTEDQSTLYLILFSVPRVTITADVIEFTDTPPSGSTAAK